MVNIKSFLSGLQLKIKNYPDEELLYNSSWIDDLERRYRNIKRIIPKYPVKVFLGGYINRINNKVVNDNDLKECIKQRWIDHFCHSDDGIKMFMIPIFVLSNMYDNEVSKLALDYALLCENKDNKYWITIDSSRITFRTQSGFYSGFYRDRKKAFKQIAENGSFIIPSIDKNSLHKKRLCILTYLLSPSVHNSMQRVAMMFANNLSKYYDETMVISIESCFSSSSECRGACRSIYNIRSSSKDLRKIQNMFDNDISVRIAHGKTYTSRLQNAIDILYSFNPEVIVDLTDEYSPLSYFYSKDYYTAYFPLRGSISSSYFSSLIGNLDNIADFNNKYENIIDANHVIEWNFPEYLPTKKDEITRKEIGIDEQAFIIISIGNHISYSAAFIDEICRILVLNASMVWLLVGSNIPQYLSEKYSELINKKRIIDWGFEDNLSGLCKSCDVLLRYNTTGGSGGTAIAAMQGLPIVMTNFVCDASRWLGKDYSHLNSFKELADEIEKLYGDRSYYDKRQKITLELVNNIIDSPEKWEDLNNKLTADYKEWKTYHG